MTLAAAATIAHEAAEMGDVDLIVEADWLIAMADPHREPLDAHLIGDRIGNSTIHIQADISRAVRRLAAGDPQAAIALAADCELRASASPMLSSGGAERSHALHAAARSLRSELGAASRPRLWSRAPEEEVALSVLPGWLHDATLTDAGLAEALRTSGPVQPRRLDPLGVLSPAEIVVADLVAAGCTNREISERLYVSRRTVESHITHAFHKLRLTSRTQLATLVLSGHHDPL